MMMIWSWPMTAHAARIRCSRSSRNTTEAGGDVRADVEGENSRQGSHLAQIVASFSSHPCHGHDALRASSPGAFPLVDPFVSDGTACTGAELLKVLTNDAGGSAPVGAVLSTDVRSADPLDLRGSRPES